MMGKANEEWDSDGNSPCCSDLLFKMQYDLPFEKTFANLKYLLELVFAIMSNTFALKIMDDRNATQETWNYKWNSKKLVKGEGRCKLNTENLLNDEGLRQWSSEKEELVRTDQSGGRRGNVAISRTSSTFLRPLPDAPVSFLGDVTIIDPFKIFFQNEPEKLKLLLGQAEQYRMQNIDFVVTYHGHEAVFVTSCDWDEGTAFEVTRNGDTVGMDNASSKFIAAIPDTLVQILREENGTKGTPDKGVSVPAVCGQVLSSGDGDFILSRSTQCQQSLKISRWISHKYDANVDVLCGAGGSWTFDFDESSDEESEEESEDGDMS